MWRIPMRNDHRIMIVIDDATMRSQEVMEVTIYWLH